MFKLFNKNSNIEKIIKKIIIIEKTEISFCYNFLFLITKLKCKNTIFFAKKNNNIIFPQAAFCAHYCKKTVVVF